MPNAAPRPCRQPGCMAVTHEGYCADHIAAARQAARRNHDRRRASAAKRGYGWRWRTKTRPRILRRDPICTCDEPGCSVCGDGDCHRPTTEVDHRVAREDGGGDDDDNLHGLCHDCHSYKTAKRDGGMRGKRTPFADPAN